MAVLASLIGDKATTRGLIGPDRHIMLSATTGGSQLRCGSVVKRVSARCENRHHAPRFVTSYADGELIFLAKSTL